MSGVSPGPRWRENAGDQFQSHEGLGHSPDPAQKWTVGRESRWPSLDPLPIGFRKNPINGNRIRGLGFPPGRGAANGARRLINR